MVARNSFIKTAFVFSSTLTLSLAIALPSFAQDQSQAQSIERDEATPEQSIQAPAELEPSVLETSVLETSTLDLESSVLETSDPEMPVLEVAEAETTELEKLTAVDSAVEMPVEMPVETSDNTFAISAENTEGAMPPADSAESEVAMAELVEALNADMDEIQAIAQPAEAIVAQTSEPTEVVTAEVVTAAAPGSAGAAAIGELTSASLANGLVSNDLVSDDPLSAIEADSVPALKAALNSDNTLTQLYAADALWTLTRDSDLVLPALISAATSGSFQTRELATLGLSYLGRQAIPAIPFLNRLLGDRDSRVRSLVQDTLAIVGSNNRPATTLGILARESSQRQGIIPTALSVLTHLWR
jgi:hypothetical protein